MVKFRHQISSFFFSVSQNQQLIHMIQYSLPFKQQMSQNSLNAIALSQPWQWNLAKCKAELQKVFCPCAQAPRAHMEIPVLWHISTYRHKENAFHQLLPSNETKESFVLLITYRSSSKQGSRSSISLLPRDKRVSTCSETQNWLMFLWSTEGRTKQIQAFPLERSGKCPKQNDAIF